MKKGLTIIAVGGNSLLDATPVTVENQYKAIRETVRHVADVIESGRQVVITHGNGPQVGHIMRRAELARRCAGMHPVPMASCVADTQGALGWQIQQALANELSRRKVAAKNRDKAVTVVTQVLVDPDDPAFANPDRFVGEVYRDVTLPALLREYPDWTFKEDVGRGWRRVVPSPEPKAIVEMDAIRSLLSAGFNVIAVGGGGIPVIMAEGGGLQGIPAVVDKDLASRLLATELQAELLCISTAVEQVFINFGKPGQEKLGTVTAARMRAYDAEGQFPAGSMQPKVQAALDFLDKGGRKAVITTPGNLKNALLNKGGTHIIP